MYQNKSNDINEEKSCPMLVVADEVSHKYKVPIGACFIIYAAAALDLLELVN